MDARSVRPDSDHTTTGEWMRRTIAMAAVLAGLVAACSPDMLSGGAVTTTPVPGTPPPATSAPPAAAAPSADAPPGSVHAPAGPSSASTGSDLPAPEPPALLRTAPLASVSHPLVHHDGELEAELRAEQLGDLLRVAVTFTPRGIAPGATTLATLLGGSGTHESISARLIDPVHLLEYTTVRGGAPQGSAVPAHVDHPTTVVFYVGAPVDPLTTFDLLLDLETTTADWPGFVDVPFEVA